MKRSFLLSTAVVFGLLFTACKKNSDSNPSVTQPGVSYQLVASNTSYAMAKTAASADIVWTTALANPDVVKFDATQGNVQIEYRSTNNAQIDLLSPVALTFGAFTLPSGTYDNISLKIDLDRNGSVPTLQLNGQFTTATVSLPVSVQVLESVELQTEQHNVTITNDSAYLAVTTIDLPTITSGITTAMLLDAQLTAGTIVISSDSNHDLYKLIVDNLRNKHHYCEFEGHRH